MTDATELVRRVKATEYGEDVDIGKDIVKSMAFVELRYDGLSLHEAVPETVGDGAAAYCAAARYAYPMGACLVPIVGEVQGWFERTDGGDEDAFRDWHHDLDPAPKDPTDERAVELADRATGVAQANGLLREATDRKGKVKPFRKAAENY